MPNIPQYLSIIILCNNVCKLCLLIKTLLQCLHQTLISFVGGEFAMVIFPALYIATRRGQPEGRPRHCAFFPIVLCSANKNTALQYFSQDLPRHFFPILLSSLCRFPNYHTENNSFPFRPEEPPGREGGKAMYGARENLQMFAYKSGER